MGQPHQVDVHTRALDQFLAVPIQRRLLGDELEARLAYFMSPIEPELRAPPEEELPQRIMVMWRLIRTASRVFGICAEDESLDSATEIEPSPWDNPVKPMLSPSQQQVLRISSAVEFLAGCKKGISLLPPKDPKACKVWCDTMAFIARDLNINTTTQGQIGLYALLNPRLAYHSGVTERNVLAMEELMVDEAQKLVIEVGERPAIEHFRTRHGFARKEAIALVRLARADALSTAGTSIEEDRAIMVICLKDLIARAKEEMNTDKELKALKELSKVQGLTRSEPEDIARSFMNVIAQVSKRQDAGMLAAQQQQPRLTEAVVVHSEYVPVAPEELPADETFDEEALAEYDQENRK